MCKQVYIVMHDPNAESWAGSHMGTIVAICETRELALEQIPEWAHKMLDVDMRCAYYWMETHPMLHRQSVPRSNHDT